MRQEFINAVESGDIITVRLIVSNELLLNPKGDTYREMKEYAEANVPELYEVHDGGQLDFDEDSLSVDLLVQIKNELDSNFSRERIAVYEHVAGIVLRKKIESEEPAEKPVQEECKNDGRENKMLGAAVVVGLGTMAYGIVKDSPLTTLSGAAIAAVSGAKLYKNKKNGR